MSSKNIRDVAATVNSGKNETTRKNNAYDRGASSLSYTWKGDAGEAFKESMRRAKTQITSVLNDYRDLNSQLVRLSNSVARAERESAKK